MKTADIVRKAFPKTRSSDCPEDLVAYARDLWPRHHIGVRDGRVPQQGPATVVWPESTDEVSKIVRFAHENALPLVPFGAGSGVCGAILPDKSSIVLDLKKMSRWRDFNPEHPSLDVEAGALGISLEEELQRKGFTTGHFPSSILCSTVGGWIAARGAGQCSGRYGKIEDMLVSMECVLGNGEVLTVKRRVGGPSLATVFVGSEGTMGVITSARLRLHPQPSHQAFGSFVFPNVKAGWEAMRQLYQSGYRPAVCRLYDPFDSLLARMGAAKGHKEKTFSEAKSPSQALLKHVLRAPLALNGMVNSLGSRALGGSMLVMIFEGEGQEPVEELQLANKLCAACGGKNMGESPARRWLSHRYSISYRQAPVFAAGAFSDTMEVAAPWSKLGALYDNVRKALGKHVFVMAHLSHAYPAGCSIYFTFAGSGKDDSEAERIYDTAWNDALCAAIDAGGTLSHHHGVGRSKAPHLGDELGVGVDVVRSLMKACDPVGILNPGNLVPISGKPTHFEYSSELTSMVRVDSESLQAHVPAQLTLKEVEEQLDREHLSLGLATNTDQSQTIENWLAEGAPGAKDPWSDPVDDLVSGLSVRLPKGPVLGHRPSPRRAVGPDIVSLFLGAHGKFGTIMNADLRVYRKGEREAHVLPFSVERNPPISAAEQTLFDRMAEGVGRIG